MPRARSISLVVPGEEAPDSAPLPEQHSDGEDTPGESVQVPRRGRSLTFATDAVTIRFADVADDDRARTPPRATPRPQTTVGHMQPSSSPRPPTLEPIEVDMQHGEDRKGGRVIISNSGGRNDRAYYAPCEVRGNHDLQHIMTRPGFMKWAERIKKEEFLVERVVFRFCGGGVSKETAASSAYAQGGQGAVLLDVDVVDQRTRRQHTETVVMCGNSATDAAVLIVLTVSLSAPPLSRTQLRHTHTHAGCKRH